MTNIDSLLFKIEMNHRTPFAGALLVSEPFLREDYFCHAVICIVEYEVGSSTMGIVLNKATDLTLNSLVPQINKDISIFWKIKYPLKLCSQRIFNVIGKCSRCNGT